VYSIGHSNLTLERLVELLNAQAIVTVFDVRSSPYSRYCPQFNRETLMDHLRCEGMGYVFAGDELGGRPEDPALYDADGRVNYFRVAQTRAFNKGLDLLLEAAARERVALLCSEEDPDHCHRRLLIARALLDRGVDTLHLRADGRVAAESAMRSAAEQQMELFEAPASVLEDTWKSNMVVFPGARRRAGHTARSSSE
jgi:uncharacterized protein (DUF488 family)